MQADSVLAHLKDSGSVTDTAIIDDIYTQNQVSANILHGYIEILDHTAVGELVVILTGDAANLSAAQGDLQAAGVSVRVLKEGSNA